MARIQEIKIMGVEDEFGQSMENLFSSQGTFVLSSGGIEENGE